MKVISAGLLISFLLFTRTLAAAPSSASPVRTTWDGLIANATWSKWTSLPRQGAGLSSSGPTATRDSLERVKAFGRLVLRQQDRGELAKGERYLTVVTFLPAATSALSQDLIRLGASANRWLDVLGAKGDLAVILDAKLRQEQVSGQGFPGGGTTTMLEDPHYYPLSVKQRVSLAKKLLPDGSVRENFLARTTPVTLGPLRLFVDKPVVNTQIGADTQAFLSLRAFNPSSTPRSLSIPKVEVFRAKKSFLVRPTTDCSRVVASKGFTTIDANGRELCVFLVDPGLKSGDQLRVRLTFSEGGITAIYEDTVSAL